MIVQAIKDFDEFLGLEEEWNGLLNNSFSNTVFLRHEWFKCWWQAYGKGKQLFIITVRESNELIAVAPLMIGNTSFRALPTRKIQFIENDESPRCDFILSQKEGSHNVFEKMLDYLLSQYPQWEVAHFNKIPKKSVTCECLREFSYRKNLELSSRPSLKSPFLQITTNWETYYKGTPQRLKKRIRHNNNRLQRLGTISIEAFTEPDAVRKILPEIFAVGQRSWKGKIRNSISSTEQNRDFFFKLSTETGSNKWPLIWLLRINNKPIAFEFHLRYGAKIHALRSEFDEAYNDYSPGSVIDSHIVKNIFMNAFEEYDMGGSADTYKTHWTTSIREHENILIFNKGIYPKFLASLERQLIPYLKKITFVTLIRNIFKDNKRRL